MTSSALRSQLDTYHALANTYSGAPRNAPASGGGALLELRLFQLWLVLLRLHPVALRPPRRARRRPRRHTLPHHRGRAARRAAPPDPLRRGAEAQQPERLLGRHRGQGVRPDQGGPPARLADSSSRTSTPAARARSTRSRARTRRSSSSRSTRRASSRTVWTRPRAWAPWTPPRSPRGPSS
jgi:hypothetical protein